MPELDSLDSIDRAPRDPRRVVRDGYDRASHAYRADSLELDARSGYAHWLRRIERRLAPGSRVLDLGCGNGLPVARELAKRHRVTGLDLSLVQVRRARILVPGARYVCADMTQVEFAPASFDAVTAFFSIINVPLEDQPRLFENIASWLVPGGWLLAVVGKHRRTAVEEDFRGIKGATMYWSYGALYEYQRWITRAGFDLVEEGSQPQRSPSGYAVVIARRRSAIDAARRWSLPPPGDPAATGAATDPGSRAFLEARGFVGFIATGRLHTERCEGLPNECGVYAILRDSPTPPEFMARSTAPVYRRADPSRPIDELEKRWVPGAQVLYFGRAGGPGVRSLLKQRIKRYLRFGNGRVVSHWGGRFIWQLRDHAALLVAWKSTGDADPAQIEASLQAAFVERYGVLPFANMKQESDE